MKIVNDVCNPKVYEKGTVMCISTMTSEEATRYCVKETERTGYLHDWHSYAGRTVIKALIEKKRWWEFWK